MMAALARYGTAGALERMKAIYESQQDPCQPELLAYFVRMDPEYAGRELARQRWNKADEPLPRCTMQIFERTAKIAMHPVLEKYIAGFLMSSQHVPVKQAAAKSLRQYGSPDAALALWDAFRYFHEYWKDHGQPGQDGVNLEVELRNAIARAAHWKVSEAELRTIESLCITGACIQQTRYDLANR